MIYVIDRYFEEEEGETLYLESSKWNIEEMAELAGLLSILWKEYRNRASGRKIPTVLLKKILVDMYGCKDVSHRKKYKREIEFVRSRIVSKTLFIGFELSGYSMTWIDVEEAEELCNDRNPGLLLQKYIDKEQLLVIQTMLKAG